ncbi:HesA/MoeB/ThiF family protein [Variovorax sp. MHTC-1]|uniref:HesA/MoeB/ThiF family protein n=1 Tax=Variovorax sp. MHTC-1 TaxID=2495593 RepID=UPI000F86CEBE|nr:ThiF family adenylyltransferase [Variovorax sp. MHTC-1]RST51287.1 ThiF family adenylyltransferase [Variovorax sp. MHTC-1]
MSKSARQSFLGADSTRVLAEARVGIVGLGGGGSHVAQQLAHVGIGNYVLVDPDVIEESNLNRLVGATTADVEQRARKVDIASRVIRGVLPESNIIAAFANWQDAAGHLKSCDLIVGGLDSVRAKDELDRYCRRYLIPYVDMGMDVHKVGDHFLIAGQVVLVTPGAPCLRCLSVVTDDALEQEARKYGAAGSKPQVVWPNGVLAAAAVGLVIQQICPWHATAPAGAYLEYDGNKHTIVPHQGHTVLLQRRCSHFFAEEAGDAIFDIRRPPSRHAEMERRPAPWQRLLLALRKGLRSILAGSLAH